MFNLTQEFQIDQRDLSNKVGDISDCIDISNKVEEKDRFTIVEKKMVFG